MTYRSLFKAWFGGPAILVAAAACSDHVALPDVQGPPADTLSFRRCGITTAEGTFPDAAECAEIAVPVRRGVASSRTVTLSVKRYKQVERPRAQLFLIAGGPGSAASDFEVDSKFYLDLGRDLELYFLDHRGTGRSERLSCATEEAPEGPSGELIRAEEWPSCASALVQRWGDDLQGFNVTEAAMDLGEVIRRSRRLDTDVFLYAVSYGTYLALRYLQLFPTQPTGVILDSICSPGKCDMLIEFDRQFDVTAREIFAHCSKDQNCAAELGSAPFAHVESLSASLATGHCGAVGWSKATLRQVLGFMTTIAGLRDYMPAVVKRLERCSDADVAALKAFQKFVAGMDTESSSFSQGLSVNILLSELSGRPLPSASDVTSNADSLYASIDAGPRVAPAIAAWPIYDRDPLFGKFGESTIPMLMLNGSLDAQTPLAVAQPTGDFYHAAHQHFVAVPYSPHQTLTQSLIDETGNTCGAELVRQFLSEPKGPLDTACLDAVLPLRFAGTPAITELLFGTSSPFTEGLPVSEPRTRSTSLVPWTGATWMQAALQSK